MGKRYFVISTTAEALIELDDEVIDTVDDKWREILYNLHTAEEIAGMVGWNMIVHNWSLSSLDGWADQPNSNAKFVIRPDWGEPAVREISPELKDEAVKIMLGGVK